MSSHFDTDIYSRGGLGFRNAKAQLLEIYY